jgi:hypothetical protein
MESKLLLVVGIVGRWVSMGAKVVGVECSAEDGRPDVEGLTSEVV